ncbi:hypothetical protein GRF29_1536g225401 [Pseudopithomyces chartarum]|uniref:NADP-dependent oxidoreductase domain-containing protein n=1 Tax=Pseudopithomyces chartarum TaxID=1892770 RepID=A0AAN6LLQ7_9PLEO|nr:hypothetical protein GRF29_1536g225401 [Pseudopithomyces chartarum]
MAPFSKEAQLVKDYESNKVHPTTTNLPGYPLIRSDDATQIRRFLKQELWSDDLETMAPRLWIMTTFSGANINPLHRQRIKGREIVITEEPRLHLVWIHNRIFIKPMPSYLLSQTFWNTHLDAKSSKPGSSHDNLCKAAAGFLRTYRYLIQHESDFHIAQQDDLRLVPRGIDWPSFCRFISELSHIDDAAVSKRYWYGELRLTRLNFYAPLLLRKFHFEQVHGQYGDFFARLYGPRSPTNRIRSPIHSPQHSDITTSKKGPPQHRNYGPQTPTLARASLPLILPSLSFQTPTHTMASTLTLQTTLPLPNSKHTIPQLGFGVYESPPSTCVSSCLTALRAGYRHIDTAQYYANEEAVGQAVRESNIPRSELYVTTKILSPGEDVDSTYKKLHPWCQQREVVEYCQKNGIVVEAYCPIVRNQKADDKTVKGIAEKYQTSPNQVLIRYALEKGWVPLPKSDTPERIRKNADVYGFKLDGEDMKALDGLDQGKNGAIVQAVDNSPQ